MKLFTIKKGDVVLEVCGIDAIEHIRDFDFEMVSELTSEEARIFKLNEIAEAKEIEIMRAELAELKAKAKK